MKALLLLASLVLFGLAAAARAEIAEPPELWTGAMHGETPATLVGAKVIDAAGVVKLKESGEAILLDVGERPKKPEKTSSDTPWLPIHLTIPGAVWLANAGRGDADAEFERALGARVAALTSGDKDRPLIVFCHPNCWGSWNVGKRLVRLGYGQVYWFRDGAEGWQEKFSVAPAAEDAAWSAVAR